MQVEPEDKVRTLHPTSDSGSHTQVPPGNHLRLARRLSDVHELPAAAACNELRL